MTNPLAAGKDELDRHGGSDAILAELRQFKKLRHLPDEEVAFRMVKSVREVRDLRRKFGRGKTRLRDIGFDYRIRLLLGQHNITTIAHVLAHSDGELLALPTLGQKRLRYIRETIREYLDNAN